MKLRSGLIRVAVIMGIAMAAVSVRAIAEEGMWTFDNPPVKLLKEKYGFVPTQQWLDQVLPPQQQRQQRPPQPQPPPTEPRSAPPAQPPEPRPQTT